MPAVVAPNYVPHLQQRRVHAAMERGDRFVAVAAGVRGGKTSCGRVSFIERILLDVREGRVGQASGTGRRRRPAYHAWIVAPTFALLAEPRRYIFESIPKGLIDAWYESDQSLYLKGDVLIEFKSGDNPLHLVSIGLRALWIDEAARMPPDAWRSSLRSRLSDHKGWALFTTSPLGRANWFYEEIWRKGLEGPERDPSYTSIAWPTIANPAIDRSEIEAAKRDLPEFFFERDYLSSWNSVGASVFPEFDERIHVVSESEIRVEYGLGNRPLRSLFRRAIGAMDFGHSAPGCILVIGETRAGDFLVVEESYAAGRVFYEPRAPEGTWVGEAKRLVGAWGIGTILCDPAASGYIFDLSRNGIPVQRADNEVLFGVRKVSEALHPRNGRPRLRILSTCKNLIRELKSYSWKQDKRTGEFLEEVAPNQSDHSADCLRYGMSELLKWDSSGDDRRRSEPRPLTVGIYG